jgi:hypothetical protein
MQTGPPQDAERRAAVSLSDHAGTLASIGLH